MQKKLQGAPPEAVVDQIYDRTGGVPLFVEEFTKMVQESGVLNEPREGGTPVTALPAHEIPTTLQDLIMARVDRLEGDREVALLAATVGREFSYELLAAIATLNGPTLQTELTKLVQAEILFQKGRPPKCSYAFKHALLEDALYNALVKSKRATVSPADRGGLGSAVSADRRDAARIARPSLYGGGDGDEGDRLLAHRRFAIAGTLGGNRSDRSSDQRTGIARNAGPFDRTGQPGTRAAEPAGRRVCRRSRLRRSRSRTGLSSARELCERVGQPLQLFAIMLGIWEWHTVRGDLRLCGDLAAEGIDFARSQNDPGIMMEALFMRGETMLYRGDFFGARESFATAVDQYDDRERTKFWAVHTSHDAGVTHRSNLAVSLWHLGYPDQALRANREMCQLAREIGHPYSLAYALHHTAWLYQLCRLGAEVRTAAEEGTAIATAQGFALWRATGTFFKGGGTLLEGKLVEALPLAPQRPRRLPSQRCGADPYLSIQHAGRSVHAGRPLRGRATALDRGFAIAEKNDERCHEAELHRLRGELLLAESQEQAAAEDCFHQAIETARGQQSRAWELRATMTLARFRQRQGRGNEARDALAAVFGAYTEGFTTPDLMEAKALLEALA